MKSLKKRLIREEWIVHTRKVGKAEMYKLNLQSNKVQKFIDFFWSVVNDEREPPTTVDGPIAIAASTKGF
ncbi:hypothetical protein CMO91_04750 [Candidatus Woesearchaeota archaeon]|nr:hypothetical protein [Candidatus Woesearchaeota archaeon]|tara:strand:- start:793 stop:1002 length:210 start_codon:yes stop_codon:yes gene_type:complete